MLDTACLQGTMNCVADSVLCICWLIIWVPNDYGCTVIFYCFYLCSNKGLRTWVEMEWNQTCLEIGGTCWDLYHEGCYSVWKFSCLHLNDFISWRMDVRLSTEKSEADTERERSLIDQWVCLTEERNAVLVPTAGSGIPGAPADWYNITFSICCHFDRGS